MDQNRHDGMTEQETIDHWLKKAPEWQSYRDQVSAFQEPEIPEKWTIWCGDVEIGTYMYASQPLRNRVAWYRTPHECGLE